MTDDELQRIRGRVEASAGPHDNPCYWISPNLNCPRCHSNIMAPDDRAELLAEVERLRKLLIPCEDCGGQGWYVTDCIDGEIQAEPCGCRTRRLLAAKG